MSYTDENDHGLHTQHHKPQTRLKIDRMTRVHTRTNTHMHARTNTHTLRDEMLKVQIHGKGQLFLQQFVFAEQRLWRQHAGNHCMYCQVGRIPWDPRRPGCLETVPTHCLSVSALTACSATFTSCARFVCCFFYQPFGYKLFMNISQKNSEGIIKERILCFSFMCVCVCVCVYIQYDVHKDYDNLSSLLKLQNKL